MANASPLCFLELHMLCTNKHHCGCKCHKPNVNNIMPPPQVNSVGQPNFR